MIKYNTNFVNNILNKRKIYKFKYIANNIHINNNNNNNNELNIFNNLTDLINNYIFLLNNITNEKYIQKSKLTNSKY